jgi:propionyl-CoA carboxylase alpha chain
MGVQIEYSVLPRRAAELLRLMPRKPPPDLSKFVLSPMPGLLVAVMVKLGQEVKAGERLVVIEAMKMQNTLCAERDGTIAELLAEPGESLAVDQQIMRFA